MFLLRIQNDNELCPLKSEAQVEWLNLLPQNNVQTNRYCFGKEKKEIYA